MGICASFDGMRGARIEFQEVAFICPNPDMGAFIVYIVGRFEFHAGDFVSFVIVRMGIGPDCIYILFEVIYAGEIGRGYGDGGTGYADVFYVHVCAQMGLAT